MQHTFYQMRTESSIEVVTKTSMAQHFSRTVIVVFNRHGRIL